MKAIILASGIGKRLQPLTDKMPKPLIRLNGKTIIERQIDILLKNKIKDIIVTTGPFEAMVQRFLREKYQGINITYVPNPQFDTTNYIYTLWLTMNYIDDDIILIHGDLVFDEKILIKMIEDKNQNLVLIHKTKVIPEKDFKASIINEKIIKISVNCFSDNALPSFPIYKFSKKDFLIWISEIDREVKTNKLDLYAEDAFNKISNKITLKPLYFTKELCMEIDTTDDLKIANQKLKS